MFKKYRKEIEKLYIDKADIYHYEEVIDLETSEASVEKVIVYKDIKCKLSSLQLKPAEHKESHNEVVFTTKLFTAPELEIKKGAFIVVRQAHETNSFVAGKSFKHNTHQEIPLQVGGEA